MSPTAPWGLTNRSFMMAFLITLITFLGFLIFVLNAAHAPSKLPVGRRPKARLEIDNVGEPPGFFGIRTPAGGEDKKQAAMQGPPEPSPITDDDSIEHYSYCEANAPTAKVYTRLENSTLISVHLMHRHGDRTPTTNLPFGLEKDAWNCLPETTQMAGRPSHEFMQRTTVYTPGGCAAAGYCRVNPFLPTFWPGNCSRGQLTPKGTNQLHRLGVNLGDITSVEKDVFVGSTDVWRTQQSATALITGMFRGPANLHVYTFPKEMETGVSNYRACPKMTTAENSIKASSTFRQYLAAVEHERTKFEEILGSLRIGDELDSVFYYIDLFQARSCHQLPAVCRRSNATAPASSCISSPRTPAHRGFLLELKRNLLLAIRRHTGLKVIRMPPPGADPNFTFPPGYSTEKFKKFLIYSAHDSSLFLFELWYDPNSRRGTLEGYRLRMLYNGQEVRTPWCKSGTCPMRAFLDYLDVTLGVVGGFENYGRFSSDPKEAPPSGTTSRSAGSDLGCGRGFDPLKPIA
ncbi:hypothetical protein L0F63_004624 [Massospora cicadina]|nr:hypothetical protein L0F63_004624 [Massospora cicadina]